jgi:hypothetical protein
MSSSASIRYKERGVIHTVAWPAGERGARGTHALGLAWVRSLATASGAQVAWSADDVLWLEPELAEQDPSWVGAWLESGAVLAVGEARDSSEADRRELAPTVLVARGSWYDALTAETLARVQRTDRATRTLLKWALARGKRGLLLRAIADQLGLARVRRALCVGGPRPEARAFFSSLGIEIKDASSKVEALNDSPCLRLQVST